MQCDLPSACLSRRKKKWLGLKTPETGNSPTEKGDKARQPAHVRQYSIDSLEVKELELIKYCTVAVNGKIEDSDMDLRYRFS